MMFIGIDPGKKGAIALFDPSQHDLQIEDMPLVPRPKGKKGEDTNYARLAEILWKPPGTRVFALIEDVWSMPKEGVSSAHAFGRNNGALLMGLAARKIPHSLITPAKWKKHFGLNRDKGASRSLAMQRFPDQADLFLRVKDDGRAEAALIALYAFEMKGNFGNAA